MLALCMVLQELDSRLAAEIQNRSRDTLALDLVNIRAPYQRDSPEPFPRSEATIES